MDNSTDTTGWTANVSTPHMQVCNSQNVYGGSPNFTAGAYAEKTYTGLLPHYQATVKVRFFFIDTWDSEIMYIKVDGAEIFSREYNGASAVTNYCGISNQKDTISELTTNAFTHTAENLTLTITTNLDEDNEAFAFNNLQIIIDLCDPACSACTGPSNTNCSSCNSGWYLEGTTCNTTCSLPEKYANSTTNKCEGIKHDSFSWINLFNYSM